MNTIIVNLLLIVVYGESNSATATLEPEALIQGIEKGRKTASYGIDEQIIDD